MHWNISHNFRFDLIKIGFQTQVQKSSESARLALATVPDIEGRISDVDNVVQQAESVNFQIFSPPLIYC